MKNTTKHKSRRERARKMLEEQLKRGTKPEKIDGKTTTNMIPLTPADITRIKREIEIITNPSKKTTIV
jgi:hypothetical protein